jgi:hypothetical protein
LTVEDIRIAGFAGCNYADQPRALDANVGVYCENQKPGRADMRPWLEPLQVATVLANRKCIYRFGKDNRSDSLYWFTLPTFGSFVRPFLEDDTTERTYFTEASGALHVTDAALAIPGDPPYPQQIRSVGVPTPTTGPLLALATQGTGDEEERFYAYVYVNNWGEVSAPSPVSPVFRCKPGAIVTISNMTPTGANGINKIRIYRTQSGASGAEFFFLREITPAAISSDDGRDLGSDVMESAGPAGTVGLRWEPPPASCKSLTGMWNGMLGLISGKAVRVCHPYKPHAWPPGYAIPCQDQPVGLASFENRLLVLTTGTPILVHGSEPLSLDAAPAEMVLSCESEPGIVTFQHGVVWPSADGLAYMGASGQAVVVTAGLMTKTQWRAMNPATMVAGQYMDMYICFYEEAIGGARKGFVIDPRNPSGFYPLAKGYPACYFDELQGSLFVLDGDKVMKWDAGPTAMTVLHRSKVFRQPRPSNPAKAEIIADTYPVTFKMWAGEFSESGWSPSAPKLVRTVTGRDVFNLPSGYLADDIQVEVSGQGAIVAAIVSGSTTRIRAT